MSRLAVLAVSALTFLSSGAALALDYASVAKPAILYDTSSTNGRKLAIIRPGTPVEIVLATEGPGTPWMRVRDPSGALSWIDGSALSKQRTVLVTANQATVRREASEAAPAAFAVNRDVVLDFVSLESGGWVKVRHADGSSGYLRATEVWGH
jgi:SH3-like domain-containing protein